ncbi:hypothetical protein C2845_PM13G01180 [Panicum miliaceum]|uniref:At1g61320/AtMIF1 LRR domain-containing protein n=1 Tax=Panicum miliaceum TaxID=4540 RepID=A0A3L6RNW0_PANMI|nr:hypothetical protein C2845_PM13G01180 [Panicum miliaceum]
MGLLALQQLTPLRRRDRQRRRRRNRTLNGSIAAVGKRKGLPCQQDGYGDSKDDKRMRCSMPALPEDIWHHIHSLLPLRDAAHAACLSRAFLRSWRCHPILTLNRSILYSKANAPEENLSCIIDNIMRNHTGIGVKIFKLSIYDACNYLDSWLQIAVTPGIEELTLKLYNGDNMKYNVPCTLLSDGVRNSIRCLQLSWCAFHPAAELGPMRKLTSLCLHSVHILGDELEYFLSNSPALKQLDLIDCREIICLKIPCVLLQLQCLKVSHCWKLRVIESKARNLSSFILEAGPRVKVSLGETLQMKNLSMFRSNFICYARAELPSNMPKLETVSIECRYTNAAYQIPIPQAPVNYSPSYDYFSLVSFLDASPSLKTWLLDVRQFSFDPATMEQESIFGASSHLRQMPEQHHGCLKSMKIKGFYSAKSLVELTCYILKNAKSLSCLSLDTTFGDPKCDTQPPGGLCTEMDKDFVVEARRGAVAIRAYIQDKVPPTVKLTVVEHCWRCHPC